eukprot:1559782-Rhodomonas_salina.1
MLLPGSSAASDEERGAESDDDPEGKQVRDQRRNATVPVLRVLEMELIWPFCRTARPRPVLTCSVLYCAEARGHQGHLGLPTP